jgi:hypothetical protein
MIGSIQNRRDKNMPCPLRVIFKTINVNFNGCNLSIMLLN